MFFPKEVCILLYLSPLCWAIYDHYRLPTALLPLHYDLRILTHLNETHQSFEGSVKIELQVREKTQNITLHVKNLRVHEDHISVNENCIEKIEVNEEYDFYILHLCRELKVKNVYQLEMHFEANLNSSELGYYKSNYTDMDTKELHYLAITQFSPTFARQAFPCFDEPSWKSTFNITLGFHKNYSGLSNMPVLGCEDHENLEHYIWCHHAKLLRTSTYLVAYSVHDLQNAATIESGGVTFRNWMQPKFVNQEWFFVQMAPKVVAYFQELFRLSFPLDKIDQFMAPQHRFSAMENWGLITYNEIKFMFKPEDSWEEMGSSNALTLAHEYAHQWFGNMVTMEFWNDLWLKEGPSTYFGYLVLDVLDPTLARGERFIARDLANFFSKDSASSALAISKEVKGPSQILAQFSEYVYQKGSLTIRMLHKMLGDEAFFQGIRSYLGKNSFENVDQQDLWESLQEAAVENQIIPKNFSLSRAMDSWTLQSGYPLVTVIRDYQSRKISLNQTRFYLRADNENTSTCWWVPLSFVRQKLPDFEQTHPQSWLECPDSKKELELTDSANPNEWLILNPQVNTIFRVNYDDENWKLIIDCLNNDPKLGGIHKLNRAQLLDDLAALASVRIRNYTQLFDLLKYLRNEPELLPWQRASAVLKRIEALLEGQEANEFRIYMQQLFSPLYQRFPKLGGISRLPPSLNEVPMLRFVYTESCRYLVDDCNLQARILIRSTHRNGTVAKVSSNFRDVAYCSLLENGGATEFQELLALFQNAENAAQQRIWATALGCTPKFFLFQQFLNLTLQSEEKPISDCYILAVNEALKRKSLASETAKHVLTEAKTLSEKFKTKDLTSVLMTLAGNLRKPEELEELNKRLKDIQQFEEPLKKALELAKTNRQWQMECSSDFIQALRNNI
ncbi:hypothetical protein KR018_007348 [Drosophila ironensis]|nr:hypothetical protein KR018_007348 [Drosophila ironensis]